MSFFNQKWHFCHFWSKMPFGIFDPFLDFGWFCYHPKSKKGGRGYPLGVPPRGHGVTPMTKNGPKDHFLIKNWSRTNFWSKIYSYFLVLEIWTWVQKLKMAKMAKMAQNPKKAPPKRLIGARNEKAKITTKKTKHPPAKKQIPHTKKNRPPTPTQNDTNARKRKSPRKRHQNHPPGVVLDPKPLPTQNNAPRPKKDPKSTQKRSKVTKITKSHTIRHKPKKSLWDSNRPKSHIPPRPKCIKTVLWLFSRRKSIALFRFWMIKKWQKHAIFTKIYAFKGTCQNSCTKQSKSLESMPKYAKYMQNVWKTLKIPLIDHPGIRKSWCTKSVQKMLKI